ncbi:hypothetical protein BO78DRAFT_420495 [Aspergillus sclerotiicarbonarius CBS 121057]|uniref:Uncharacterized protein n=1 Tax=Aspergillus sclerotiicarbonarius (strain CBS 121057 / IBT 28362) TaxID=1448318 RepID=A0A319E8U6_ASPSB|nr:hypothetical protein BO78DRAFT_420495 [Aspergillus sclerotiicarbonarius CBS 121057]
MANGGSGPLLITDQSRAWNRGCVRIRSPYRQNASAINASRELPQPTCTAPTSDRSRRRLLQIRLHQRRVGRDEYRHQPQRNHAGPNVIPCLGLRGPSVSKLSDRDESTANCHGRQTALGCERAAPCADGKPVGHHPVDHPWPYMMAANNDSIRMMGKNARASSAAPLSPKIPIANPRPRKERACDWADGRPQDWSQSPYSHDACALFQGHHVHDGARSDRERTDATNAGQQVEDNQLRQAAQLRINAQDRRSQEPSVSSWYEIGHDA